MKKVYLSLVILIAIIPFQLSAQEPFVKRGILRAQATISPGRMTSLPVGSIYIHGDLEYYFDEKLSVRGDSYYFLGHTTTSAPFAYNHSTFSGIAYHFTSEKKFDPYISFEPGVAFSKVQLINIFNETKGTIDPLISAGAGFNFYATKYFHLLGSIRYVHGKHLGNEWRMDLNEFRFSFGLGFNLRVKKYDQALKSDPQFRN